MKAISIIISLFLFISLNSLTATAQQKTLLKIRIIDSVTSEPVSGLIVNVQNTGMGNMTDSNGDVTFDYSEINFDPVCVLVGYVSMIGRATCINKSSIQNVAIIKVKLKKARKKVIKHNKNRKRHLIDIL